MIFQGFHFGPSTQGGTYYPCLTMCCPREGRDPQETLLGVHRRTHSRSQQPLGLLLGSHMGPTALPRALLVQIPQKCIPFEGCLVGRGHEVLKLLQGKCEEHIQAQSAIKMEPG